jgi:hypothetical protein
MTFQELHEAGFVEHHRCGICGDPVGYSIHPNYAAAVFDSSCGCGIDVPNYRLLTLVELASLELPADHDRRRAYPRSRITASANNRRESGKEKP